MAPVSSSAELPEVLQRRFGSDLRGVMLYSRDGAVSVEYLREDLGAGMTDTLQEERIQEFLMDLSVAEIQERTFSLGQYAGTARFFDEATILNFILDSGAGLVVSLEPGTEGVDQRLLDWCRDTLDDATVQA